MIEPIGELYLQNGKPLLSMWFSRVEPMVRNYLKHAHSQFEIAVVNSGSGEYTTETAVYPMRPGDIFVFSSNEIHYITKVNAEGLSLTNLHFEPHYLNTEFSGDRGSSYLDFCFSHAPEFCNRIPAKDAALLSNHHGQIRQEFTDHRDQYALAIRAHLHLLLIELLRSHNYGSATDTDRKQVLYCMLSVYEYIEQHLEEELTLKLLANVAGLSPNYFSHLFKELHGISLWDYIHTKRIEKAMTLIRSDESELTMLDIALECGFNNTVHFNKTFKKVTGITPGELRRNPHLLTQ